MDKEKIGAFLCNLRKDNNLTQEDIAKKLFTSRENVSKWERGINMPTPDTLLELSKIYNVSVNEILLGEKKSKENLDKIDNISLEVMRESHIKIKKITKYFITIIIILVVSILSYYFINTYNSIHVFFIGGSNDSFDMFNGIAFFSKEKSYIRLGKINCKSQCNIDRITFIYMDNNKVEHQVYSSDEIDYILTSTNGFNQYFSYSDMKYIIENSYLIIKQGEREITLKLNYYKDMSNNILFETNSSKNLSEDDNTYNVREDILVLDNYFKLNYKYDDEGKNYYKNIKNGDKKISIYYSAITFNILVLEELNNKIDQYSYNLYNKILDYSNDSTFDSNFLYDAYNKQCINGNCNDVIINHFFKDYYDEFH